MVMEPYLSKYRLIFPTIQLLIMVFMNFPVSRDEFVKSYIDTR